MNSPLDIQTIVIDQNTTFEPDTELRARILVRGSHIAIEGNGLKLVGPGVSGDLESFEGAGVGIYAEGVSNLRIDGVSVRGFETGMQLVYCNACVVESCDFSHNYDNPSFDWGELPPRGGLSLRGVRWSVFSQNKATYVWDGVNLLDSDDNLFEDNDFSHCSNVCAKLWNSSRNKFLRNDLSFGIRIDCSKGEVHARDSTGVLIETNSNDNFWYRNDITEGGDGVFIRPLNGIVSTGNVFIENDCSRANNNCFESWSPGNTYIRNKANGGSYGFWLGHGDQTYLIGNEAAYNGLPDGLHNAPEPDFGHGGIVCVNGEGNHFMLDGNHCHHNTGGGIVFRGHRASKGKEYTVDHWVVQNNRCHDNDWGLWGQFGKDILVSRNDFSNNKVQHHLQDIERLEFREGVPSGETAPRAVLKALRVGRVGHPMSFDASGSSDPRGRSLRYTWNLDDGLSEEAVVEHTYRRAGFFRVSLTVDNGELADIAWANVIVTEDAYEDTWTDGSAKEWICEPEGTLKFDNDTDVTNGNFSLRIEGVPVHVPTSAMYPMPNGGSLDLTDRTRAFFWLKASNPNLPAFEAGGAGPVLRMVSDHGEARITPVGGRNYLASPRYSEGRWLWSRYDIPLAGDGKWERTENGHFDISQVTAFGIEFMSGGSQPFTLWVDGLRFD